MLLISHRGNINCESNKNENCLSYLLEAINKGYEVEADVWYDDGWWLGHDKPTYKVEFNKLFLFWCHAKNSEALQLLNNTCHVTHKYFWHEKDTYTLTSNGYIWVYPTKQLLSNSICVLPEKGFMGDIHKCGGICSDFIEIYR